MEDVLRRVLERIKPDADLQKRLKARVGSFIRRLSAGLDAEVIVGGSFAKDSYLSDVKDIDIYAMFDRERYGDADISKLLYSALKSISEDITVLHGSRDYFQIRNSIIFEIVPIIAIRDSKDAFNITDISPLHVKWVRKHCSDPDQIRLLKAFAKAQGFYGAESYIMGFSGYALEILTCIYGSFRGVLEQVSGWKGKVIIDPEKQHKDVMFEVNSSKTKSPLVLIDPVEAGRNTTASLSQEKMDLFISKAKEFLKSPDESFFEVRDLSIVELERKAGDNRLIVVEVKNREGKEDVEGCRILKVHDHIISGLERNGFRVLAQGWTWNRIDKAMLWYILEPGQLEPVYVRRGPPVKAGENAEKFRRKYQNHYEQEKRLYAKVKREFLEPKGLILRLLDNDYVRERVISARVVHG